MAELSLQHRQQPGTGRNGGLRPIFMRVLVMGIAVFLAVTVVPGIESDSLGAGVGAVLVLTLLNTLVRPLLYLLSLPLIVLSLGLFLVVINALLLATHRRPRERFYRRRILGLLLGRPRHQRGQRSFQRHLGSGTCQRQEPSIDPSAPHHHQS